MMKVAQGGWVPLMLGALICCVMRVWQKGNAAVQKLVDGMQIPIGGIAAQIASGNIPRGPGTAVFLARLDIPALLKRAQAKGYPVDPSDVTYFIARRSCHARMARGYPVWYRAIHIPVAKLERGS
jgi:K+ transporter